MTEQLVKEAVEQECYQCPGEKSKLTRVMCLARQAHHYEKCAQCPFRETPKPKAERLRRVRI